MVALMQTWIGNESRQIYSHAEMLNSDSVNQS